MTLYPIKFEPIYIPRLWGRELWLISGMPGAVSVVANGIFKGMALDHLIQEYKEAFLGKGNSMVIDSGFPLLLKILEAEQTLSVQVHPDDAYALANENSLGKTEMWYVLSAGKDATLVYGFNQNMNETSVNNALAAGTIERYLNHVPVHNF